MNLSTFIVLAIVAAAAVWAVRTNRKKGTCGHKEQCGSCVPGGETCRASEDMVERMRAEMERAESRRA